jgi:Protein of unknown function (DUF3617)
MMKMSLVSGLAGALAVSFVALAQSPGLKPGKYEIASEISMAGRTMPPRKDEACYTTDDVKDLSRTLVKDDQKRHCTVSNSKVSGTALSFTKSCTSAEGLTMTYTGDVMFTSAESYRAVVTMKDSSGRATNPMLRGSTITTTAKRIGECAK